MDRCLELTTPEYLPPEILEHIESKQKNLIGVVNGYQKDKLSNLKPWSLDIWSFGAVVLEMIIGFPIWMSYKGRIVRGKINSSQLMTGIFGV
jgi:serine/threonine protein kinase